MSNQPHDGASEYRHHDATLGSAPDRSARTAVQDSFPASDPVATTAAVGSRAVDPAQMMPSGAFDPKGHRTLRLRFADREHAKRAAERIVREVPLALQAVSPNDDGTLTIVVGVNDVARTCRIARACDAELSFGAQVAELGAVVQALIRNPSLPASTQMKRAGKMAMAVTGQAAARGAKRTVAAVRHRPLTTAGVLSASVVLALVWQMGAQRQLGSSRHLPRSLQW